MKLVKHSCLFLALSFITFYASAQTEDYSWDNLPKITEPVFKEDTFNIIKYGAIADGITLNTESINAAIVDCSNKGGGVVLIPQGIWLTGPIVLKSNVDLHLSRSALLQFTSDKSQYKLVEGNYEGHPSPRNQSPISGTDLINIGVTGDGIIDAHGEVWRTLRKDSVIEVEWKKLVASGGVLSDDGKTWYPSESYRKGLQTKGSINLEEGKSLSDYESMKDFYRPNLLVLTNCKKVLLEGTTFQNSPAWCLHTLLCEDLTLRNVRIRNEWDAQNGDGIDVESCKGVLIEGSTFETGDDGICVKSGRDEAGRKRGKPTENMIVRNDVVYRAHGGFVIGSEMSGGAKNIFVSNCTFIGTDIGLRFKTTRGRGGIVEKIYIKNISMRDILNDAILFDMYYSPGTEHLQVQTKGKNMNVPAVDEGTPQFRDFYVKNIVCDGAGKAIMIRGLPEMSIKDIHLEDLVLRSKKGVELIKADNISLKNVTLLTSNTDPVFNLENCGNIKLDNIKYSNDATLLFSISGDQSNNIKVLNTDTSKAKKKVEFNDGADEKALMIR